MSHFDPTTFYRFVEDRVTRGAMLAVGYARAARALSALAADHDERQTRDARGERPQGRLQVVPLPFSRAAAFVAAYHRHLGPPPGHRYSAGVFTADGVLRGVAIVGRPVARLLDDGRTLELTRVATDGTPNACSALLGHARREARRRQMRLVTYTLVSEPGTSLRAAGFVADGVGVGGSWSRAGRSRRVAHPLEPKQRWVAERQPGKSMATPATT